LLGLNLPQEEAGQRPFVTEVEAASIAIDGDHHIEPALPCFRLIRESVNLETANAGNGDRASRPARKVLRQRDVVLNKSTEYVPAVAEIRLGRLLWARHPRPGPMDSKRIAALFDGA
jgi:hypothetical protein